MSALIVEDWRARRKGQDWSLLALRSRVIWPRGGGWESPSKWRRSIRKDPRFRGFRGAAAIIERAKAEDLYLLQLVQFKEA